MIQCAGGAGLALETGLQAGIVRLVVGDYLDRHFPAQAGVARAVDLPHPARAQPALHLIWTKALRKIFRHPWTSDFRKAYWIPTRSTTRVRRRRIVPNLADVHHVVPLFHGRDRTDQRNHAGDRRRHIRDLVPEIVGDIADRHALMDVSLRDYRRIEYTFVLALDDSQLADPQRMLQRRSDGTLKHLQIPHDVHGSV